VTNQSRQKGRRAPTGGVWLLQAFGFDSAIVQLGLRQGQKLPLRPHGTHPGTLTAGAGLDMFNRSQS
jgi:hypothetical protein